MKRCDATLFRDYLTSIAFGFDMIVAPAGLPIRGIRGVAIVEAVYLHDPAESKRTNLPMRTMTNVPMRYACLRQVTNWKLITAALWLAATSGVVALGGKEYKLLNAPMQPGTADGATILRRLGETYAGLGAYYDSGVCVVHSMRHPELNSTQRFTTRFERSFYFSWVSDLGDKSDYRITFDGVKVVERWYGRNRERPSLRDAIAGATGVSASAAFWIPTLLMPEMIPGSGLIHNFQRAPSVTRLPDEDVGGGRCFVLRAQSPLSDVRVWINSRDFLIRRIQDQNAGSDAVTTTNYTPQTDIALTP